MTIDDLSKAAAADKDALSAKIKTYEADIKKYEAEKADADKQVTRLKEANENAEKLATIAEEIASAKEDTDVVVADF
jgi:multidrug resistance efflux pump